MMTLTQSHIFALLATISFCCPAMAAEHPSAPTGEGKNLFWQLSSEEMKRKTDDPATLAEVPAEARDVFKKGEVAMYESRLLAEQYFAATREGRKLIAPRVNADSVRDVVYEIVETVKLQSPYPPDSQGETELAFFAKWITGPYEGLFLVRPSDGKPLEKYHMVFDVVNNKRCIAKVEKDASFDATAHTLELEKTRVLAWLTEALKGEPERVVARLPKAAYPFIDTTVSGVGPVELNPKMESKAQTIATKWEGIASIWMEKEGEQFRTQEKLLIRVEKKGDIFAITSCKRDEAFAESMKDKIASAEFILSYISQPDKRTDWLARGGRDDLPKDLTEIIPDCRKSLPYALRERKRVPMMKFPGDTGRGTIYEVTCWLKVRIGTPKYLLRVLHTGDSSAPFLMLEVLQAYP
jgi:hypothetical protein